MQIPPLWGANTWNAIARPKALAKEFTECILAVGAWTNLEVEYTSSSYNSAFLTAGVLTAGLISFRQGNSHLGQKLMRARVVVQGATVALMVGTAYYYGEKF
ncbi:UNVERIFIED_CONTAM: RING-H2 finger protein ATL48 [Sesamum radiatum]|uniref:RING-H2 finger protein ATL48 n=1 Tax=Sesamum radiatum TaxID=300843 RepID=A0AAW2SGU1_SESRA